MTLAGLRVLRFRATENSDTLITLDNQAGAVVIQQYRVLVTLALDTEVGTLKHDAACVVLDARPQ